MISATMGGPILTRQRLKIMCLIALTCLLASAPLAAQRIVSLGPNLTEICCKLALCDHLVGVTQYCLYPPQVRDLPRVGGYIDPNLEVITAMQPDLVLALPEHQDTVAKLKRLGIEVVTLRNWSVADIYASIAKIGELTDRQAQAEQLIADMRTRQAKLTRSPAERPRVLMVLGHQASGGPVKEIFVVGQQGFLNELLTMAGGDNVYDQPQPHFPKLSQEDIIRLQPDHVILLIPQNLTAAQRQAQLAAWHAIPHLEAARQKQITIYESDHVLQAGPRFLDTLAALRERLESATP